MTTPPYQPGPYGQPNQDPYGQGGYGQQRPPQQPQYGQPQYGGQYGGANDQTQQIGGAPQTPYGGQYGGGTQQWPGAGGGGYGGLTPPPEPPKQNTGMIVAIITIAVLVLAGAGVGLYFANKDSGGNNAGGETSTSATGSTDSSEEEPTEETTTTTEETADPGEAIDAQPGDCIKVNIASSTNADVETVDCAAPEAVYRVATREETDTESCPNDQYVSYTEEGQLLLCLQLNVSEGDCLEVSDNEDKRAECSAPGVTHKVVAALEVDDENQCPDATTEVITYPQPPLTICLGSPTA